MSLCELEAMADEDVRYTGMFYRPWPLISLALTRLDAVAKLFHLCVLRRVALFVSCNAIWCCGLAVVLGCRYARVPGRINTVFILRLEVLERMVVHDALYPWVRRMDFAYRRDRL